MLGLMALAFISYYFEQSIRLRAEETYEAAPLYWFNALLPFVFGLYISFLFVRIKSISLNVPILLFVTIPCLFLSFYSPVSVSYPVSWTVPSWLLELNTFGMLSLVGGLSLMVGLFGGAGKRKKPKTKEG
ncbi:hypothetical protein [Jeotgalibacillus proteolyticus]|nr:hypothetical protein [Jeotgalibacillus proteolyticus]